MPRITPTYPGDLAEQHPTILEIMLFSGAVMLIPESWFLRPLLTMFGFGPSGPIKGWHLTGGRRVGRGKKSHTHSFCRFICCMGSKPFLRRYYSTWVMVCPLATGRHAIRKVHLGLHRCWHRNLLQCAALQMSFDHPFFLVSIKSLDGLVVFLLYHPSANKNCLWSCSQPVFLYISP